MPLSKRERVIRTLEHSGEPDICPIHSSSFEKTGTAYQVFKQTDYYKEKHLMIKNSYSQARNNWVGEITDLRFFNVDCHVMDPFKDKIEKTLVGEIAEHPNCHLNVITGKIYKFVPQVETGLTYRWYIDGYFKKPDILERIWEEYGKPTELILDTINYSPKIWQKFVESLAPYLYPMAKLPIGMHEALFEGMTMSSFAYLIRKNPQFIHKVIREYTKTNIEIIKRFSEAGVDIVFYFDDLGYKGNSILSPKNFQEFILPYYRQIYQECKKRSMFIVQHSCGYIDKLLPFMVDAGLDCIQALEPAAGVDLAFLKESLGDRVSFMGGMDSSRILNFGTPQDIADHVRKYIKVAGEGGGYFAGPSHNLINTPWENVVALRDAIEKYRKYPLKF